MKCLEFVDGKHENHPRFERRNFTIERKVSHHWAGGRSEQGWCSSNGSKSWIIWNNLFLWILVTDRLKMLKLKKRRLPSTPQMNHMICWIRKSNRAARMYVHFFDVCAKWRHEILNSEVLTQARSRKYFILCLNAKRFRTKQVKGYSINFIQHDQHWIIAKYFIYRKVLFWSEVFVLATVVTS